ncbi:MAG: hypothetical protein ACOYB2_10625 [Limnohabitans sp.]
MAFSFTHVKYLMAKADFDFDTADIRLALLMENTTATSDVTAQVIDDIVTLDEYDGAGYTRKTCTGNVVTQDDLNGMAKFMVDPVTWVGLGVGTRQCVGVLVYAHVTDDTDSIPVAFIDSGGFPFDGDGTNVVFTPNAYGFIIVQ